jgi:hypothetical protein
VLVEILHHWTTGNLVDLEVGLPIMVVSGLALLAKALTVDRHPLLDLIQEVEVAEVLVEWDKMELLLQPVTVVCL